MSAIGMTTSRAPRRRAVRGVGSSGRTGLRLDDVLLGGERQSALLDRRWPRRSPVVRSLAHHGVVWFRPHHWAPDRSTPGLPLQIHFDLKEGLGLPRPS